MANTKTITDKVERKKVKRTARKKAAPKAQRTYARGSREAEGQEVGARTVEALVREVRLMAPVRSCRPELFFLSAGLYGEGWSAL